MKLFSWVFGDLPKSVVTVMGNFGWMFASRGLAAVFSLIYLAIVTRSLGVSGFGEFALINSSALLLSNLLAFQTWQVIIQYGVGHLENGDEGKLARLYRGTLLLDVVSAVTGIIVSGLLLYFLAGMLGMKDTLARATFIFNVIMLISMRSTPLGMLRLRNRFSLAAAADSVTPTLRLIGAIIVGIIHPTVQAFLIAWAIAELLTAAAHWFAAHRTGDLRLLWNKGQNVRAVFADNPRIVSFALNTNFTQSLNMIALQLPLLLVGGLTGTAAAGAFRLAAQLSRALNTLSQMLARAAFPEIVRAARAQGAGQLAGTLLRSARITLAAGTGAFILVWLIGRQGLILIGGVEFGSAYYSLLWLTAAACIDLAGTSFEPGIMAVQRANLAFIAKLSATLVMLGAAFALEPVMGAEGIAAAVFLYSICFALMLGLTLMRIMRKSQATPPPPPEDVV